MLLYAIAKFVVYTIWCSLGLRLFAQRRDVVGGLTFGGVRWLLGLAFGLAAAIGLGSISRQSVATLYFAVYVPLRIVEWTIMAAMIVRRASAPRRPVTSPALWLWVLGGIAVSFASDLLSPEGMAGRFCVGRCIC